MQHFKDQLNRIITLKATPKRIVSLVPSQTELLVDLGLEEQIVGITKFCIHPKHLRKNKVVVGGTKDIKIDKVKALQPDIILCNKEENTQDIVETCATICNVHVSDIYTVEDCLELISQYGALFSVTEKANQVSKQITKQYAEFQKFTAGDSYKKTAYFIWKDPWMVAGKNTYINYMLKLNKFDNVFSNLERYPEVSIEDLKANNPEIVLLSSEPYPFKEKHIEELKRELPQTKICLVDGEAFSWYGSRLIQAFAYFKTLKLTI